MVSFHFILRLSNLSRLAISTVKQNERQERIRNLAPRYHEPLGATDLKVLNLSAAELAASVQAGTLDPRNVLTAYSKKALKAHVETNCLTEIMISAAELWAANCNREGPLAGIPISLKDVGDSLVWTGVLILTSFDYDRASVLLDGIRASGILLGWENRWRRTPLLCVFSETQEPYPS